MGRHRTSNSTLVSWALAAALAALIFFAPSYGWRLRDFLRPPPSDPPGAALIAENDVLKAQLAALQAIQAQLPTSTPDAIRAMVYSRYPMNFKNELLVNAGTREGVVQGSAAVYQGMLLGQVVSVYPDSALIRTIFDDGTRMPVRIGAHGYDGLLQGGAEPLVGSIAAGDAIAAGDIVYTAAPGMPYALPIAEVTATGTSPDNLFEQASIDIPYDINNVQTVLIVP